MSHFHYILPWGRSDEKILIHTQLHARSSTLKAKQPFLLLCGKPSDHLKALEKKHKSCYRKIIISRSQFIQTLPTATKLQKMVNISTLVLVLCKCCAAVYKYIPDYTKVEESL